MAILNRLEAAGKKYPNVAADVYYRVDMVEAGDTDEFWGKVYYQAATAKTPARFRIHFDVRRQSEGPRTRHVEDYVFDGSWLTVRKQRTREFTRYQTTEPGKRVNALELGRGPFPVPFGQKARTVIKYFAASTRAPAKGDPAGTDYLRLIARPRHARNLSMKSIDMWVDRRMGLPVKIVVVDRSENISTVDFVRKTIRTPKTFPKDTFALPTPRGGGWDVRIEKFSGHVR
jgi:outer membrane lipoprotein-sorting protein